MKNTLSPRLLLGLAFLCMPLLAQDSDQDEKQSDEPSIAVEEVVTASKRPEKRLEAPSTIEKVDAEDMLLGSGTTYSSALAQVKGIDFGSGGINLQKISTRGFSSSFNSRMLSLIDGRLSTLPGAGLPQGGLSSVSPLDIQSLEVVLGPAGALYGSNTTAGVLNVITKTPWDESGYAFSARGGQQSLFDFNTRLAGENGSFGWKLTAEYLNADEFDSNNVFTTAGGNQTAFASDAEVEAALAAGTAYREYDLVDDTDVSAEKVELTGYHKSDFALISVNYGYSNNDNFGVTSLGRNRILDWEIQHFQVKASSDNWFFQVTQTEEEAGDTYSIQNVPGLLAAGATREQAYEGAKFINNSSLLDAELQGNANIGPVYLVGGVSYRDYDPSSEGSYLDDVDAAGNAVDISRDELGIYLQADFRAMDERLRFVLAVRHDDFSEFDAQTSPKFGVTYRSGQHFWRANYITSYRAPEIIENHLFFFGGLARGNLNGYEVYSAADNSLIASYDPLSPEEVKTIELGYRGILGSKVVMDAVFYQSDYDNFISPLQTIAHPAFGTYALTSTGEVVPFLLTYLNYGAADIEGADLGFDFYLSDQITLNTNIGYSKLKSFDNNTTIPDIPFNTPEWKSKINFRYTDFIQDGTFLTVSGRWVDEYDYLSGRWADTVEANTVFDLAAGYRWLDKDMNFKLSWSNIFDSDKAEILGAPTSPSFLTLEVFKKF